MYKNVYRLAFTAEAAPFRLRQFDTNGVFV